MAARQNPQQPAARTLRLIGWTLAVSLALIGRLFDPSLPAFWLQLAGAAVFAVATVRPSAMRPVHTGLSVVLWPVFYVGSCFAKSNNERRPPRRRGQIADTGA